MYWLVFIILLYFLYKEIVNKKIYSSSFYISYAIISLLLILRKGQGTDYYNYKYIYDTIASAPDFITAFILTHGEPGYLLINQVAIDLGISFEGFIALFSIVTMICYYPFFNKVCQKSIIPIFIYYSTFFLIYAFSGIRQGLALAIIVSYVFPLLGKKINYKFFFYVILAALFHMSAIVCLLMPFIYNKKVNKQIIFIILLLITPLAILRINILNYVPFINLFYTGEKGSSNSILALLIRIIALVPIFLVNESIYKNNPNINGVKNLFVCGYVLYCLLSFNDIVSSRINVYFRIFEGLFVFLLIYKSNLRIIPKQIAAYYTLICFITMVSNINGFIVQGEYKNSNAFTYPYLSIFDSSQTIREYRFNFGSDEPD